MIYTHSRWDWAQNSRADLDNIEAADLPWGKLQNSTVLISGGGGFLGGWLILSLLELNRRLGLCVRIKVIVRDPSVILVRFGAAITSGEIEVHVGDVCSPHEIDGPVDWIIHCASHASPRYYGRDPVGTLNANVLGTHNLLTIAREKGSRGFLFFSTSEVYGEVGPGDVPTKEEIVGRVDCMNVRSCYAESKRLGETMCVSWFHQFGVPTRIVRPFHTYGPGLTLDDGRVHADFVADVVARRDIRVRSDGRARRAFCYVADATLGFLTVLLRGQDATAYNVGDEGGEVSIGELAHLLADIVPELGIGVVFDSVPSTPSYLASAVIRSAPDTSKIRALGWSPCVRLADGFLRTIRSYT